MNLGIGDLRPLLERMVLAVERIADGVDYLVAKDEADHTG